MSEIVSRPFRPSQGCEKCVFSRGEHASFCPLHGCTCQLPLALHMAGERHAPECQRVPVETIVLNKDGIVTSVSIH